MKLLLVGAGGHARTVMDAINDNGHQVAAYADPATSSWLQAPRIEDEDADAADFDGFVIGIGGISPDALRSRLGVFDTYRSRGFEPVSLVHSSAYVAADAEFAEGAMILPRATVTPHAAIGAGAIVNTGAIVEHKSQIGAGAHVAPGAIVLGDVKIGECAMVGAGAVVLPEADLRADALVPALGRFPK